VIDITLIFLFSLHTCFGLKTILYELGFRREKLLVRLATGVALILSVVGTVIYLRTA
jgi:succinate dehydrogenase hydrophobic anchor subunit